MLFEDTYSFVFIFYRILAMVPYRFTTEQRQVIVQRLKFTNCFRKLESIWLLVLFLIEIYILIDGIIVSYERVLVTYVTLYTGLDLLIVTTFRLLLIIITMESFLKRRDQLKILQNLYSIDTVLGQELDIDVKYPKLNRLIIILFIKWSLIYVVTEAFLIWLTLFEQANSFGTFLLLFVYPLLKLTLNGSRYITLAHLVKHRIQLLQEVLKSSSFWIDEHTVQRYNGLQLFCDRSIEISRMVNLWKIYRKIYETADLVNYSFKWSFSINFSIEILAITAVLFHVLDYILGAPNRFSLISLVAFGLYLFYYVFRVAMLIQVTHCTTHDAKLFAASVHRLCYNTAPDKLYNFVSVIRVSSNLF